MAAPGAAWSRSWSSTGPTSRRTRSDRSSRSRNTRSCSPGSASPACLPRAYLFDTTPRQLDRIAGPRLSNGYRGRIARFRSGPGVFKLDYALDGPVPWRARDCLRAGTVHLGGTLDEIAESEEDVARGRVPEHPFVLVGQQSLFDRSRAPAGKETLWAYCHVPNGSAVDMTGRIEAQLERFAPGFRDRVLARSAMGPAAIAEHNENYLGGDIGGGASSALQLFA